MQDGPNIIYIGDQRKEPNVNKYEGKMQSWAGKETVAGVINYDRGLIWPRQARLIMRQHTALAATRIQSHKEPEPLGTWN